MGSLGFTFVNYDVPELLPFKVLQVSRLDGLDEFDLSQWKSVKLKLFADEAWNFLFEQG